MKDIQNIKNKIILLKKAKQALKDDKEAFICMAIESANNGKMNEEVGQLTNYISDALGYNAFLTGWIRENAPSWFDGCIATTRQRATEARILWVDWMIACYNQDLAKLQAKKK